MGRANPFGDLSDFAPKVDHKPVEPAQIERIAEENGFPSRQAPQAVPIAAPSGSRPRRRYTTGRNQQINIKATAETIERLSRIADRKDMPLGKVLELALAALEQADKQAGP